MRERFFTWLARVTCKRALIIFLAGIVLTAIFGGLAEHLRMDMTWNAMVPENHPAKDTFEKVIDEFGAATQIVIALEGPGKDRLIEAAEKIESQIRNVTIEVPVTGETGVTERQQAVKRVEIKYNTGFIAENGLMLVKAKDLRTNFSLYTDYNLVPFLTHVNNVFESEYVYNSDNLTKQEKEAERMLDGFYDFIESLSPSAGTVSGESVGKTVDAMTIGDGYYLSTDKKMLLIFVTPTVSLNDPFDLTVLAVNAIEEQLNESLKEFPDITAGMTGGHVVMRDEMEAGMEDTIRNVIVAFVIIMLIFMISFRMLTGPVIAMLVLMAGISWDMGLAYLVYGRLNIMTAMCAVILLGLGVDFAVHILSAYTEFRHKGNSIETAMREAFLRTGPGLVTGAVTTSAAFLALMFTSYPVFREFGFVVGAGILCCLLASLFFLPSVIILKERLWKKIRPGHVPKQVSMEFRFLGKITNMTAGRPVVTLTAAILITGVLAYFIKDVYMNRNYMDMEPEGLESVRLQREIPKRFSMSADNMIKVTESLEEAERLTDLLNERSEIGYVESLSDFLPSAEKQRDRIPEIKRIAEAQRNLPPLRPVEAGALIEQLKRFGDNLDEMSSLAYLSGLDKVYNKTNFFLGLDEEGEQVGRNRVEEVITAIEGGDGVGSRLHDYQRHFKDAMNSRVSGMANMEPLTLEDIPDDIRERFISSDGNSYLIMIYAKKDIWDGLITSPFVETVLRDVPGASGMPILMKAMVQTAKEQGAMAFVYAFIAFFIILMVDFRSLKTTLIATLPLTLSLIWMVGIMGLSGFPFSIINIIGLPLILGIGIDDGVHIIHRYKVEGRVNLPYAVSSIGKAIMLTTLTTGLGFGSLIPSSFRGYASLGILVALGIGLCFIMSVILLPSILQLVWGNKDHPEFFKQRA
ncbi:RND family transporter [candidate division KSB1 bacterium]